MPVTVASPLPADGIFLGFDSSTQSLKATAVDAGLRICASECVNFDAELPHYGTKGGVHKNGDRITAPCLMWLEALELILRKLQQSGFPFRKVCAVSGSGQQHGSVYWRRNTLNSILKKQLDSNHQLHELLQNAFSKTDSPIWMDSSTTAQCRALEKSLGGASALAALTGSRAYERFTGPQIKKLYESEREVYKDTERISLVSSFMASILIGNYASIDHSDGAGMNLMDLKERSWSDTALKATAPDLEEKLGPLAAPHAVAGTIHPFFVNKYDFAPDCLVIQWSGDNPCSLAGLALDHPGDIAVSLGTSDTVFGVTENPHPGNEGHVFPNPVDPHSYMAMLCYKNGSLTREDVRNRHAHGSWETFNSLLKQSPPLNGGKVLFLYNEPEILPPLPAGTHRFVVGDGDSVTESASEFSASEEIRALIEGQFVAMRAHAARIGLPIPPNRIIATGGASANQHLLEELGAVFGCQVYRAQQTDSASLGAAIRAAHGWVCEKEGKFVPFNALICNAAENSAVSFKLLTQGRTSEDLQAGYARMTAKRAEIEAELLAAASKHGFSD